MTGRRARYVSQNQTGPFDSVTLSGANGLMIDHGLSQVPLDLNGINAAAGRNHSEQAQTRRLDSSGLVQGGHHHVSALSSRPTFH